MLTMYCQKRFEMARNPISGDGLQDELEFLLADVNALANRLKSATRAVHAGNNLPVGAKTIFQTLAQVGLQTVPQLARRGSFSRQNIQVLVNRLEAGGWVEFVANPAHKRSDLIRLTDQGERLLATATKREASFLAGLLNHTTEAEVLSAGKLLTRLRQLLGGSEPMRLVHLPKPTSKRARPKRRIPKAIIQPPKPAPEPELVESEFPINLL